ncbi:hypothetical protein BBJ28_00026471 [Nothophytophthora sp. Chile5]|nr:hypothetical protein BBJ28_00026471 [Nothophytophthora sp. Chile5]
MTATRNQTVQQETDELEKQQEALKKRIEQAKIEKKYSAICTRLKLLPTMARNARGVDYDIVLDAHTGGVEAAEKLSAYLKQHIRPSAKRFKEERVRRGNTALDEALQLQEHVQRNSEILSLETQKERNWEAQVKKLDDALRREREVREEAIAQKQAATEDVELKMESIRNERDSAAEEIQTQKHLAEVKQASAVMIETYRSLLDKNRHEVANVLMACTTHKAMIDRAITSLENEIDSLEL